KRLLQGMERLAAAPAALLLPADALNRLDFVALHLGRQHDARAHRLAIEQHRTRAALACLAAVLHTNDTVLAQHVEQRLAGARVKCHILAIQSEGDVHDAIPPSASVSYPIRASAADSARRATTGAIARR